MHPARWRKRIWGSPDRLHMPLEVECWGLRSGLGVSPCPAGLRIPCVTLVRRCWPDSRWGNDGRLALGEPCLGTQPADKLCQAGCS